jgi:hypothetical protein
MDLSLLPIECWTLIADNLSSHDLSLLARVSTSFHVVFSPHLYCYIDLSIHRLPPIVTEEDGGQISLCSPSLSGRQRAFTSLILYHKPKYASWVRSLTWTMCLQQSRAIRPFPEDELDSVVELFSRLNRVCSVDINGGSMHFYPPKPIPPLFPAAHNIRLSGQMHYGFASAILHGHEKTPLKTLAICNLHERGHTRSGQNYQEPPIREDHQWGLAAWDESDAEPMEEDWAPDSLPQQVPPGPMRHLLNKIWWHDVRDWKA